MLAFLTYLALNQDPFADFRSEFAKVMLGLFGIMLTVSAVVVAIHLSPAAKIPIYPPRQGPQVGVETTAPASINAVIYPRSTHSR